MYYRNYRRRYKKKKHIPTDIELLGYDQDKIFSIIKKRYKNLICTKCQSETVISSLGSSETIKSGPYGLYYKCLSCQQNSPIYLKFDVNKDEKLQEIIKSIELFDKTLPKVKKVFNKFIELEKEEIEKINKKKLHLKETIDSNNNTIKKIEDSLDKFFHDASGWAIIGDVFRSNSKYHTPVINGKQYFLLKENQHSFNEAAKPMIDLVEKNKELEKRLLNVGNEINDFYELNQSETVEFPFMMKYCRTFKEVKLGNFKYKKPSKKFLDPNNTLELEIIEHEHYNPLLKEKEARINLLKKIFRLSHGYIYVLGNDIMPNLYKVGWTERSPEERAKELSSTGLPSPFKVVYSKNTNSTIEVEKQIHKKLDHYRYRTDREFFKTDLENIKKAIEETLEK